MNKIISLVMPEVVSWISLNRQKQFLGYVVFGISLNQNINCRSKYPKLVTLLCTCKFNHLVNQCFEVCLAYFVLPKGSSYFHACAALLLNLISSQKQNTSTKRKAIHYEYNINLKHSIRFGKNTNNLTNIYCEQFV